MILLLTPATPTLTCALFHLVLQFLISLFTLAYLSSYYPVQTKVQNYAFQTQGWVLSTLAGDSLCLPVLSIGFEGFVLLQLLFC